MTSRKLNLVVAACQNRGIGKDGQLPWRLKGDMAFFKRITSTTDNSDLKNAVIMGRKTWDSIPQKFRPLANRINVIISRNMESAPEGAYLSRSLDEAIDLVTSEPLSESVERLFVIGGSSIYQMALASPHCHRIYYTDVMADLDCDTFLPEFDTAKIYKEIQCKEVDNNLQIDGDIQYKFHVYEKVAVKPVVVKNVEFDFSTPDMSHLTENDYLNVYEPAEDTFLFLDALQADCEMLKSRKPLISLEIGSGSGVISTFLAQMLGRKVVYLCTDINVKAAEVTNSTGVQNNTLLNPVVMDFVGAALPRLQGKVDVLLFNPPYVVTPPEEVGSKGIEASWAGGADGREVIDRFLPQVPMLLSDNGVFYLVVIKENKPDEIDNYMKQFNLTMTVVLSRRSGPEFLSVLKFTRQ